MSTETQKIPPFATQQKVSLKKKEELPTLNSEKEGGGVVGP